MHNFGILDFDIYSKRIGFYFYNKEKIGSYFGLFLTILYVLILFVIFFIYLLKTVRREEIKVYDSSEFSQEIPIYEVSPNSIYFAFGLEDPTSSNRFIDESIYYPKIVFFDRTKKNGEFQTVYREELDYEKCDVKKFGENYRHLLIEGDLNNSYCLKNYNLTLAGGYKYNRMSYFRIRIYPCRNNTENNNYCKPKEIIEKYFKGGYFSILIKDIGLNPSNYTFPVLETLQDLYITIDKQIYRDYIIYYGITEIKTDTGLFVENIEKKRYLDFRKDVESFNFRDENDFYSGKATCSVAFRLDDIIKVQSRSYTKFKEVFASTGGYMQLISTIFTLLSLLSNRLTPELKIINGIFNFNLKQQKMMMKMHSIKDFNIANFHQMKNNTYIYFPPKNPNIGNKGPFRTNDINKGNFLDINNDNSSSLVFRFNNNNDEQLLKCKGESTKQNNHFKKHIKTSITIEPKNVDIKDKGVKNDNFLSIKLRNSNVINGKFGRRPSMAEDFAEKINFNFFQYYCFGRIYNKTREINLFKLGINLYKKTMDIINVFTFLLLVEKNILYENHHKLISSFREND